VFWHDCCPSLEHAEEIEGNCSNICDPPAARLISRKGVASARPTKMWESNSSESISRKQEMCQFGKGIIRVEIAEVEKR
jgi:hypothetical protein